VPALLHAQAVREQESGEDHSEIRPAGGFGSLGSILHLLVLAWAAGIASFRLTDNSFFTHLATGRIILDEGRVPSSDPYSFTAAGEPWTVQSWLASVAYGTAEQIGSDAGLRVLMLAVFLGAMTVLWKVTSPAPTVLSRMAIVALALFVVTDLWGERPYMVGVIGLGLVWLAQEGRLRPWLLVPVLWVWVNAHGSFPLGIALVLLTAAGDALDRRLSGAGWSLTRTERTVALATVGGTLLGGLSPVGPKLLWFPLTAASKSAVFSAIIEWRPPAFQSGAERAFLLLAGLTLVLLVRRSSYRLALPAVAFTLAAVYAQRNVVMATVVLVAVLAQVVPAVGTLRSSDRPSLGMPAAVAAAVLVAVIGWVALTTPVDGFGGYPARAVAFLGPEVGPGTATEISTGNLLTVLDGQGERVFIDDRVDMYPEPVFEDYLDLFDGRPTWQQILDRHRIETVVWSARAPLSSLIATSDGWQVLYADADWIVGRRRDGLRAR